VFCTYLASLQANSFVSSLAVEFNMCLLKMKMAIQPVFAESVPLERLGTACQGDTLSE
jgi:hypothetical protein